MVTLPGFFLTGFKKIFECFEGTILAHYNDARVGNNIGYGVKFRNIIGNFFINNVVGLSMGVLVMLSV